jgi:hypothetical protein
MNGYDQLQLHFLLPQPPLHVKPEQHSLLPEQLWFLFRQLVVGWAVGFFVGFGVGLGVAPEQIVLTSELPWTSRKISS